MTSPQDEFTELVDADIPRVDLVDKAANGTRFLIAKQSDRPQAGLLDPEYVRNLIGKSAGVDDGERVTMSGSPGAIARLIHEAAQRQVAKQAVELSYEQVIKAKYNAEDLRRMAANGQAMDDESYPIADKDDLDNAIRAVGRGGASHDAIRRHIITRARSLGASSEIPDNWNTDGSLKEVSKMIGGDMDEGQDGLDPTVILASPDDVTEAPGDPNDPGSPAWEAIDAATARKWTSILARARGALEVLADREMLEAATADPSDAEDACDLQDAACAIDYAISILAPFAVDEQAEADCGADMEAVGKALAGYDPTGLDTIEATSAVRKAGRSLSAANEQAIRDAVSSLQTVLASLPAAPVEKASGPEVAKTANEELNMPAPTTSSDVTEASGQEPAMGTKEAAPKQPAGTPVSDMAKADGDAKNEVVVVYDQKGRLVGIVDPSDITPVANAEADTDDMNDDGGDDASNGDGDTSGDDAETPDLTPQPAGEAGTPADAAPSEDDNVTKSTTEETETLSEMFKSSLLAAVEEALAKHSAGQTDQITKTGDAVVELAELIETLKSRVGALEEQPAEPKVFTNGAVPPAHQLRGQDRGAPPIDVAKARELKNELYRGQGAGGQNQAAIDLQALAIARLQEIHGGAHQ